MWKHSPLAVVCSIAVVSTLGPADAQAKAPELEAAAAAYREECAEARRGLLDDFDRAFKAMAANTSKLGPDARLHMQDVLKKERERFESRGLIPWSLPMRSYLAEYFVATARAEEPLKRAYLAAIDRAAKGNLTSEVSRLQNELASHLPKSAIARWKHGAGVNRHTMVLYPDGHANDPENGQSWKLESDTLVIRTPNSSAPGGAWIDRVKLAADGQSYRGKNQIGTVILGDYLTK